VEGGRWEVGDVIKIRENAGEYAVRTCGDRARNVLFFLSHAYAAEKGEMRCVTKARALSYI